MSFKKFYFIILLLWSFNVDGKTSNILKLSCEYDPKLIKKESNDFHNASRDFVIENQGKLFSIFGGKWTTSPSIARKIATIV